MQQQSEIVLVRRAPGTGLTPTQPAFRGEMFEKGNQAAAPVMVPCLFRKRAGDRLATALVIDEAGVRT